MHFHTIRSALSRVVSANENVVFLHGGTMKRPRFSPACRSQYQIAGERLGFGPRRFLRVCAQEPRQIVDRLSTKGPMGLIHTLSPCYSVLGGPLLTRASRILAICFTAWPFKFLIVDHPKTLCEVCRGDGERCVCRMLNLSRPLI